MTSLNLTNLTWSPMGHGHCHHQFQLRDASVHVAPGEFVGLIGPNGSGKTSLLRCAWRFSKPERGEVRLDHRNVWKQSSRWYAQRIAVVLQEFPDAFGLTVEEVVAMGRTPHKGLFDGDTLADHDLINLALESVGLKGFENHGFAPLSGGEKQRVILARALAQQPQLLILDEPTNHLDPRYQLELLKLVKRLGIGGDLTPQTLQPLGINVYELSESCAFVMKRPPASLEDTYNDLRNLGKIFDVQDRANAVVANMQAQVADIRKALPAEKPRVFLYDSGEDRAMTSGRLGMPQALIDAAGGRNVLEDVDASWTRVNWESVVERNPQVIVIVDYSEVTAEQKIQFLLDNKALQSVDAIKHQRFIVIPYVQATPGIDNALAVATLAKGFHGE